MTGTTLDLALVQPRPLSGARAPENLRSALAAIERAGRDGAQVVLFPEGYPGPMSAEDSYDAAPDLARAAARARLAVCWSRVERDSAGSYLLAAYVHGPDGRLLLRYVRSHPATGDVHPVLNGTSLAAGPEIAPLFDIAGVTCGLLICSELWLPEIARVLALRGAEVLLAPAGGGFGRVAANWRLITRARAVENEAFVAMTQGLYGGESGSALIAGPEGEVAGLEDEGVTCARLDIDRARWLRATDDSMQDPKPFSSLPGLLRARRPALYAELSESVDGLYDYGAPARTEG